MPDLGILTLPLLGVSALFLIALFTGSDVIIDNITVPPSFEALGYTDTVITGVLTDELRELNRDAAQELAGIAVGGSPIDKSLSEFEKYYNLSEIVNGVRMLIRAVPYHVEGNIVERGNALVFTVRINVQDDPDTPNDEGGLRVVEVIGSPDAIKPMIHEASREILNWIDPYIVALYHHRQEFEAGEFAFPKTRAVLREYMQIPPVADNSLAYDLIGRMHSEKARLDPRLTDEERRAERASAIEFLYAALVQAPGLLLPHLNLATLYAEDGQFGLADRFFAQAVRIDPEHLPTRERWAETLAAQGRIRDAIFQYVAAVELNGDSAELRNKLAHLYVQAGRPDAARTQWEWARLIDPANRYYRDRLGAL